MTTSGDLTRACAGAPIMASVRSSVRRMLKPLLSGSWGPAPTSTFGIEESALIELIDQLGYDLYLYDKGSGKLRPHPQALIDSNYLMILYEAHEECMRRPTGTLV